MAVILLLLGVYVLQYVINGFRAYKLRISGDRIVLNLKKDIYEKAQYLPMSFYDRISTGSVINRVNSDATVIQNFIMKITQEAVIQAFTLVGLIVIMFMMSWRLALFSLIPVPIVVFVGKRFGKVLGPKYMRMWRRSASISSMLRHYTERASHKSFHKRAKDGQALQRLLRRMVQGGQESRRALCGVPVGDNIPRDLRNACHMVHGR